MDELEMDAARRFGGLNRLYGPGAVDWLQGHVTIMVVGVGGVGSWAAEALARSAVGHLKLLDLDQVSESNINRQIQADSRTLGMAKVQALAQRIATYAPLCRVEQLEDFLDENNVAQLMQTMLDLQSQGKWVAVLDCCDNASAKTLIAQHCRRLKLPFALAGSAGGKQQPWLVQPADLRDTTHDPLLAKVRYQLRKAGRFDEKRKMGVPVFYSPEQIQRDASGKTPQGGLNCAGYGSLVSVTATMGMQMAAWAITASLQQRRAHSDRAALSV